MRVKKDKCYLVVTKEKEYIQGAFPFSKEGKKAAQKHLDELSKKDNESEYRIKVG